MSVLRIEALQRPGVGPLTLSVDGGECVGISGPSGSGKTLMLRAVADLDPHEGDCRLDDVVCTAISGPRWRRQVGLLLAESQWWFDTIGAHFDPVDERVLQALGFDATVLEWDVSRCSTGERQRLALARLLCRRPRVLLLDEPTASLDQANITRVEGLIADYRRRYQAPVIWVSHDPRQLARVAQRQLVMGAGRLGQAA